MSLNGLDTPQVQEAYHTAAAEAGGWFLLKYTSRDAVDLLDSGKNGVAEARNAIKEYTDASPLYGLIIYRRRRILIKYIPEGTSRLLQARTAVHLSDVLERYAPYETLLEITSSEGLNDTSLASSFQLHTASPSPSTSRLDEIREDGEDSAPILDLPSGTTSSSAHVSAIQKYKAERRLDPLKRKTERAERSIPALRTGESSSTLAPDRTLPSATSSSKPSMSRYLVHEEQGQTSVTRLESPLSIRSMAEDGNSTISRTSEDDNVEPADSVNPAPSTNLGIAGDQSIDTWIPASSRAPDERLTSSASPIDRSLPAVPSVASTSTVGSSKLPPLDDDDPYDLRKYDEWFKPKVKLGPRPVNPSEGKNRPTAARVSALPASFKPAAKKHESSRPVSQMPASTPYTSVPAPGPSPLFNYAPPPIPASAEYDPRPVSRGSIKSTPSHKSTMMTPDKLRLMKAIEHRKRQMRKSRDQQFMKPPMPEIVPEVPEIPSHARSEDVRNGVDLQPLQTNNTSGQPQSGKADSGIEIRDDSIEQHEGQKTKVTSETLTDTAETSQDAVEASSPSPVSNTHPEQAGSAIDASSLETVEETREIENELDDKEPDSEGKGEELALVPTIVMADGSRPIIPESAGRKLENAAISRKEEQQEEPVSEGESTSSTLGAHSSPKRKTSDLAKRRRGFVEPLQIEINSGNPDDFASDDEFLEELHSAAVLEARPIMVARSPVTNTPMNRKPSADTLASVRSINIIRSPQSEISASTPSDNVSPEPEKTYVPSGTTLPTEKADTISSRNVSSGISKRIQLLTNVTNRELVHSKAPSPRPRPTSFKRHSSHRSAQSSAAPTPTNENAPTWSIQHDPATNRNSVSVTARIVRTNVAEDPSVDRAVSPTDSQTTMSQRWNPATEPLSPLSTEIPRSNAPSPAMSPVDSRSSSDARTLYSATSSRFGRRRQNSAHVLDDFPPAPKASSSSNASIDESGAFKEAGRTSRFLKRISNIGGPRRKNSAQTTASGISTASLSTISAIDEHSAAAKASGRMSMNPDTPPGVVVGDLNVQFPDSLLWKRRIVTIDDAGHLQFAIAHAMEIHKGVAQKRYPLSEFRAPYAPDLDTQELPHSVVLELLDGTALQAACEDAMTQRQVLHLLRTYWKAWSSTTS